MVVFNIHKQDSFPLASKVEHLFQVLFHFRSIETNFNDADNEEGLSSSFGDSLRSELSNAYPYDYLNSHNVRARSTNCFSHSGRTFSR